MEDNGTNGTKRTVFSLSIESRELYDYMHGSARVGKVWTYEELDRAAKCDVRGRGSLQTVRRMFLREGIALGTVRGEGVKVLSASETVSAAVSDIRHISRTARRAMTRTTTAKYEDLSAADKVQFNTNLTVLSVFKQFSTAKSRELIQGKVEQATARLPIKETLALFGK